MMRFEEFWIGKDIDLEEIWRIYDDGTGYITKYRDNEFHFLRISFENYPKNLPLFNLEVIHKTFKSIYHDVKQECLTPNEYNLYAPLYSYSVNRGSGIWELLAQQYPAILFILALIGAYVGYQKFEKESLEILDKKLAMLKTHFPDAKVRDKQAFLKAWNFWQRRRIVTRLIEEGLTKIEIAKDPFSGNKLESDKSMITIHEELPNTDATMTQSTK